MMRLTLGTYQAVQREILERIQRREWPPGTLIPNEAHLADSFGCARATVNRALRELAETGIVERKRRAGTRVALNPVSRATLDIPIIRHEVEARGAAYGYTLIDSRQQGPTPQVAARLGLASETPMLHVTCLHFADHQPFCLEVRWVHVAGAPGILDAPLDRISPNEWLVREVPYSHGEISFGASKADAVEAGHLQLTGGEALFIVERTTWLTQTPITLVRMAYPPGYRMITEI